MLIIILAMAIALPVLFILIIRDAFNDDPWYHDWDGYEDYEDRIW
jgi:hypothetical protein